MASDAISASSNYPSRCWRIITCQTQGTNLREIWIKMNIFLSRKCTWKNISCKVATILQTSICLIRYGTRRTQNSSNEICFKGMVHSISIGNGCVMALTSCLIIGSLSGKSTVHTRTPSQMRNFYVFVVCCLNYATPNDIYSGSIDSSNDLKISQMQSIWKRI